MPLGWIPAAVIQPSGPGGGRRRYTPQCGIGMPCDCEPPPVTSASVTAFGWCGLPKVAAAGGATVDDYYSS